MTDLYYRLSRWRLGGGGPPGGRWTGLSGGCGLAVSLVFAGRGGGGGGCGRGVGVWKGGGSVALTGGGEWRDGLSGESRWSNTGTRVGQAPVTIDRCNRRVSGSHRISGHHTRIVSRGEGHSRKSHRR